MDRNGKKMVEVYDGWSIAVPPGLAPEQEAALIAQFRAENPLKELEAEMVMARGVMEGTVPTVSMEQLLAELEAEFPPEHGPA